MIFLYVTFIYFSIIFHFQQGICCFLALFIHSLLWVCFSYLFWSYLLIHINVLNCNIKFELQQNQKFISVQMTQSVDAIKQSLISTENNAPYSQAPPHRTSEEFELTPLEKLLQKAGGQHTYQFKSFMIFNMMWFLTSWLLVGQGFFFDNTFQCNDYQDQEQCQRQICKLKPQDWSSQIYSHANSIVFAFQGNYMICSNDYLVPIMSSLLYLGSLIGFFVIPYIADNWGRKVAIKISWAFFIFGLIFIALADSPNMIAMGQFVSGFGCNPAITICYSFINEQVLGSKRQRYGVVLQIFLAFGQCIIAFMFLPKQNWKIIIYILLGLTIVNWLLLNYLLESPKFLIGRSKKQTLKVLNQIARRNNKEPIQQNEIEKLQSIDSEVNQGTSILDLFKYKSLRWATLGGGFVFMAIQVIYYGTLLNLDHIGYSKLINQEIIGVSQAAGYLACQFVISKIKRKKWSFIGLGISFGLCFVLALLTTIQNDDNRELMQLLQTGSLVLLRFVLCAFWALFYLYIAQLYPTKVRSMGFGWASAVGTLGSAFAPYMIFQSDKAGINSWIAPGVFGVFGFICIFCLSQTFGKPLHDDIEEVRLLGKWELSDNDDQQDKAEDFPKTEEPGTTVLTFN